MIVWTLLLDLVRHIGEQIVVESSVPLTGVCVRAR
jgi:hypothetical protein